MVLRSGLAGRRGQMHVGEQAHGCGKMDVTGQGTDVGRNDMSPKTVPRPGSMKNEDRLWCSKGSLAPGVVKDYVG